MSFTFDFDPPRPPNPARPAGERDIYTVSRLNKEVRLLLESGLPMLWLEAEISNFAAPASGHWYFSLKDAQPVRSASNSPRSYASPAASCPAGPSCGRPSPRSFAGTRPRAGRGARLSGPARSSPRSTRAPLAVSATVGYSPSERASKPWPMS